MAEEMRRKVGPPRAKGNRARREVNALDWCIAFGLSGKLKNEPVALALGNPTLAENARVGFCHKQLLHGQSDLDDMS